MALTITGGMPALEILQNTIKASGADVCFYSFRFADWNVSVLADPSYAWIALCCQSKA